MAMSIATVLELAATISVVCAGTITRRASVPEIGFYSPLTKDGGSMLTQVPNTFPAGQGEPLNVIISGNSDPRVLIDSADNGGLQNYFLSMFFGPSCGGGITLGDKQATNLGDGQGYVNESQVFRYNYHDPIRGTCNETTLGGNHFRYWAQKGSDANSSAVFLAVSYELPLAQNHDIAVNGYNLGRDWLIGNATQHTFQDPSEFSSAAQQTPSGTASIVPASQSPAISGTTSANGYNYSTQAFYVTGLSGATSDGVNHNATVMEDGRPALDGLVAVLVVNMTGAPANQSSGKSGALGSIQWLSSGWMAGCMVVASLGLLA